MSSDATSTEARLRLARFRPGGRRGAGRERLPVHQPARATAGSLSPLVGHYDNQLAWKDDNYKKGSVPAGDPPVSFRAAPTYVLERAARQLHRRARADRRGDRRHVGPPRGEPPRERDERRRADVERAPLRTCEAGRLGNETSEGALTWNVLRSCRRRIGSTSPRAPSRQATSTRSPSSGSGDGASSASRPRRGPPSRMAPMRASTFPAGAGS